jgi:hypothetical protein
MGFCWKRFKPCKPLKALERSVAVASGFNLEVNRV